MHIYIHICVRIYAYAYICIYIYAYAYMHMHIYIYIYINAQSWKVDVSVRVLELGFSISQALGFRVYGLGFREGTRGDDSHTPLLTPPMSAKLFAVCSLHGKRFL